MSAKLEAIRSACLARAVPDQLERLEQELAALARYRLVDALHDLWQQASEPGTGNQPQSLVAHLLGLTTAAPKGPFKPPLRYRNERLNFPDIDMDFADDRRDELIEYASLKYGQDRVAQIITFGTMAARAAIRDAGRALGLPLGEVDRVAKLIPFGMTLDLALEAVGELRALVDERDYIANLYETARMLEGVTRHASTHAAGVVISRDPLTAHVPLVRAARGEGTMTQYAMEEVEKIGLLKMDFLGLSTLTVMRRCLKLVEETRGERLRLEGLPLHDPAIYELLGSGETTGIFQLESAGFRKTLKDFRPTQFSDVMAILALYRPGPMQYIDDFIRRKNGQVAIQYHHARVEPILAETYGIMVYQEQIIRIAMDIAGYTPAEADQFRRAVGKKKEEELLAQREAFIAGAVRNGLPRDVAKAIFNDITYFARYGFNKAHSCSYAVITCQTAYLKARYPVEYMAALATTERDNTDKLAVVLAECGRLGIRILPPDVNASGFDFTIEEGAIRFGLSAIKNVGEGAIETLLAARSRGGLFTSLDDLCQRVDLKLVNRRAVEALIRAGAMDRFGSRVRLLAVIDQMLAISAESHRAAAVGQMSLFGGSSGQAAPVLIELPALPAESRKERLAWEKELLGAYVSGHPLGRAADDLQRLVTHRLDRLEPVMAGQVVTVGGLITGIRQIVTRKGDPMAFVALEDVAAGVEVVVFPRVFAETRHLLVEDGIVLVVGKVDERGGAVKVLADKVVPFDPEASAPAAPSDQGRAGHGRPDNERAGKGRADDARAGHARAENARAANGRADDAGAGNSHPDGAPTGQDRASPDDAPPGVARPSPRRHLHVTVPREGDLEADKARLAQVYRLLSSRSGPDRFTLYVGNGHGNFRLDFPGNSTTFNPELQAALEDLVGPTAIRIEPLGLEIGAEVEPAELSE